MKEGWKEKMKWMNKQNAVDKSQMKALANLVKKIAPITRGIGFKPLKQQLNTCKICYIVPLNKDTHMLWLNYL